MTQLWGQKSFSLGGFVTGTLPTFHAVHPVTSQFSENWLVSPPRVVFESSSYFDISEHRNIPLHTPIPMS